MSQRRNVAGQDPGLTACTAHRPTPAPAPRCPTAAFSSALAHFPLVLAPVDLTHQAEQGRTQQRWPLGWNVAFQLWIPVCVVGTSYPTSQPVISGLKASASFLGTSSAKSQRLLWRSNLDPPHSRAGHWLALVSTAPVRESTPHTLSSQTKR